MNAQPLTEYCNTLSNLLSNTKVTNRYGKEMVLDEGALGAVKVILAAKSYAKKVMVVGNGGSAAIASHMQNDLAKAVGVKSLVFDAPSLLTALSNDLGYEHVYEYPIEQWAEDGDVLVAISSSGNSENIVRAAQAARGCGCKIVTLTGFQEDNALRQVGDINFYVPCGEYGFVESGHAILAHFFTDRAVAVAQETMSRVTVPFQMHVAC